jgi:hypothetical protein
VDWWVVLLLALLVGATVAYSFRDPKGRGSDTGRLFATGGWSAMVIDRRKEHAPRTGRPTVREIVTTGGVALVIRPAPRSGPAASKREV